MQNVIGEKFNRLTVISRISGNKTVRPLLVCTCECGQETKVQLHDLKTGHTKSCGCLNSEMARERRIIHGHSVHGKTSKEYWVWAAMIQRCTNKNNKNFSDYGGRGIAVCERWLDFKSFLQDMGEKPSGYTLERKNNYLGYFPDNCVWETHMKQSQNRRYSVLSEEKVRMIREMRKTGHTLSAIAKVVNASISAVSCVDIGRTWSNV